MSIYFLYLALDESMCIYLLYLIFGESMCIYLSCLAFTDLLCICFSAVGYGSGGTWLYLCDVIRVLKDRSPYKDMIPVHALRYDSDQGGRLQAPPFNALDLDRSQGGCTSYDEKTTPWT